MTGPFRLAGAAGAPIGFRFNGRAMTGRARDTLAAALLANGQRIVGRSFKYHRPRGILSAGPEEPNALVTLGTGAEAEPNTRATVVELHEGLEAFSQNHLGPLTHDLMAVNDLFSPILGAGFYYKTFMWPRAFWEKLYEPAIRRAAGLGALSGHADPGLYDRGYLHCDVLVIGAGPAGLAAALAAAESGARVLIADEDNRPGGRLLAEPQTVEGMAGADWARVAWDRLGEMPNVRRMPRTTVFGSFDHGVYGAVELAASGTPADMPRQVMWRVYARRAVLCAGATERPLVFPGNDRPGVMLAGAVDAYLERWKVAAGRRVAVMTNHAGGAGLAERLRAAGVEVAAVLAAETGEGIAATRGRKGLSAIRLESGRWLDCDALAVGGGWSPNLQLTGHAGARPVWHADIQAFVPGDSLPPGMTVAGAASGDFALPDCLSGGDAAGAAAAEALGFAPRPRVYTATGEGYMPAPVWRTGPKDGRAFVDLQHDVTVKDIALAHREGFVAVEHLKRYTTLGMATDQGKTSNVPGLAILSQLTGRSIPDTGTTRYRPPATPVTIGALAGRERGRDFKPYRYTPAHDWAVAMGASMVESGLWLRAEWFAEAGETGWRDSVDREARSVRETVGICDVSTLGKIDIQGRDATRFVDFVYCNGFAKLAVGRVRYGLMLREDGMVMDDGTCARLAEDHYLMTTTTANAASVYRHLEFVRQVLHPDWDVHLVPETDGWSQFSVAGPRARDLLARLVDAPFDISNEGFPFMACADLTICGGTRARLFRISFSGELAYEIAVPARYGNALAAALTTAGADLGVLAYGVEALDVMRMEKGHPSGNELNGQTAPRHLGMGRMASQAKDYIGRACAALSHVDGAEDVELVGVVPVDRGKALLNGAHILAPGAAATLENDEGWMSSVSFSPQLGHHIGLAFIRRGQARMGERLRAVDLLRESDVEIELVPTHFFDPEGGRLRA
jgi:sarcosine oxidase subunit alpha